MSASRIQQESQLGHCLISSCELCCQLQRKITVDGLHRQRFMSSACFLNENVSLTSKLIRMHRLANVSRCQDVKAQQNDKLGSAKCCTNDERGKNSQRMIIKLYARIDTF